MSYAIVRNEKLTRAEINGESTHNDRKAKNHSNKDIDPTRTHLNYYIKKNEQTYTKEFDRLKKEGKNIEKICGRDFWKGRDSYRKLQDAYFNHVKSKGLISWICKKFDLPTEDEVVREFERENNTCLDAEKQLDLEKQKEERSWDLER